MTAPNTNVTNQLTGSRTDWHTHDRFGLFIHWGLYAIPARGEWLRKQEKISDAQYQVYFDEFNPTRYDPRTWASLAKRAGQKYAVLTARHHEGFCLFDSKLTDFKATNTPAGRDLVREYLDAFREEGLKVGLYNSLLDWHHPDYPIDRLHPLRDSGVTRDDTYDFSRYVDYLHGLVRELLTNYGKIDILWLDFSYDDMTGEAWRAQELVNMIRSLQPDIIINNRLTTGHTNLKTGLQMGDFSTPEQIIPSSGMVDAQGNPLPWEACITINESWGYSSGDHNCKNPTDIIHMLVECVSKNGNLLLNVGPDPKGEIPDEHVDILEQVGRWMRKNSESIYGCGSSDLPKPEWGRYTQNGNILYAHILDKPMGPISLNGLGGRVRKARLLSNGTELAISKPWNAADCVDNAFFYLPGNRMPDPIDTVVMLELIGDSA